MKPTALDAPPGIFEEDEQRFAEIIREHGWFHTAVLEDDEGPGFSYSTGFGVGPGHPELIVFGWKHETASSILWDIYRAVAAGETLQVGVATDAYTSLPIVPLLVDPGQYREYLGWNRWFYGNDDFACLQLVWPDRAGLFPWQSGFDAAHFGESQVDLTAGDWKGHPAA